MSAASTARDRDKREEPGEPSPEPWAQLGRYVRDANGRIVMRGKTAADIRRVVACVNALAGVPIEAVEHFTFQVAGGAGVGPDPALAEIPQEAVVAIQEFVGSEERRMGERRRGERRRAGIPIAVEEDGR